MKLTLLVLASMIAVAWSAGCSVTSQDCTHIGLDCKNGETPMCKDGQCVCGHDHGKRQASGKHCTDTSADCSHANGFTCKDTETAACKNGYCVCESSGHGHGGKRQGTTACTVDGCIASGSTCPNGAHDIYCKDGECECHNGGGGHHPGNNNPGHH